MTRTFDFIVPGEVLGLRPGASAELETIEQHLRAALADPKAAWWDDDDEESALGYERLPDGTAVIRIEGPIMGRSYWWSRYYRCACTPDIAEALDTALADTAIQRIVLMIDSPGGAVSGLTALSDKLFAARDGEKPITAYIAQEGCSAAYWLASQCRRIFARPESLVGCIGTISWLASYKGMLDEAGIAYEPIISDGAEDYKATGSPYKAITDADRAYLKQTVNDFQALFSSALERGLGISSAAVAALANGQAHAGTRALELGLIDGIATWEEALTLACAAQPEPRTGESDDEEDDSEDDSEVEDDGSNRASRKKSPGCGSGLAGGSTPGQSRTGGRGMTLTERIQAALKGGEGTNDEKLRAASETIADLQAKNTALEGQLKVAQAEASAYRTEVEGELQKAAVRAFGAEKGPELAAGFAGLPIADLKAKASAWNAAADKELGTSGEPGKRASAPSSLPTAADVQTGGASAWSRLSAEQQKVGAKFATTDEQKEAYARRLLGEDK